MRIPIVAFCLAIFLLPPADMPAQMPAPPISGFVVSAQQGPVAGVTVSLVHPAIGRSSPAFTAANGGYYFTNVPARPEPFYIEAYWGNQLLYRSVLYYNGAPVQHNIPLP